MKLKTLISCFHSFFSFNSCILNCVIERPQRTLSLDMDIFFSALLLLQKLPSFLFHLCCHWSHYCVLLQPPLGHHEPHRPRSLYRGHLPKESHPSWQLIRHYKRPVHSKFEQDLLKTTHFPFICWS